MMAPHAIGAADERGSRRYRMNNQPKKSIKLALQGGDSHGAFAWGCSTGSSRMSGSTSQLSAAPAPAR
jgi:hypothetical protein